MRAWTLSATLWKGAEGKQWGVSERPSKKNRQTPERWTSKLKDCRQSNQCLVWVRVCHNACVEVQQRELLLLILCKAGRGNRCGMLVKTERASREQSRRSRKATSEWMRGRGFHRRKGGDLVGQDGVAVATPVPKLVVVVGWEKQGRRGGSSIRVWWTTEFAAADAPSS